MPIAEQIYQEVQTLPDELAREVLDFVYFIEARYALKSASDEKMVMLTEAITQQGAVAATPSELILEQPA